MDSVTHGEMSRSVLVEAVAADLARWGLEGTALGAAALDLARALDDPGVKPTPRSMLHAQLRMTLESLAKLAPEEDEGDVLDELAKRRDERRSA